MKIYIMRHAQAENKTGCDFSRKLTKQGIVCAEKMGELLATSAPEIDCCWVSPLIRAEETYNGVAKSIKFKKTEITVELEPDGSEYEVLNLINKTTCYSNILLVSHLPIVSYIVSLLTKNSKMIMFAPASLVCIDYSLKTKSGQLLWQKNV